ncbi:MAG TPA: hypothetical protein VFP92_02195 [Rhodanobacteraceae bacterium]|nr:hypothetical protein [Rhodanobacteraceae bacterium]
MTQRETDKPDAAPGSIARRSFLRGSGTAVVAAFGAGLLGGPLARAARARESPLRVTPRGSTATAVVDPDSHFFATANVEYCYSVTTDSDGDLWPSCWADDGHVYAANGDGKGFGPAPSHDICVSRLSGTPETDITGVRVAAGEDLGRIWADPKHYNRKPTGMLAVDGNGDGRCELYLAIQNLHTAPCPQCFNDAPSATIVRSDDYGETWQDTAAPMFTDHAFTTIFFLDFGKAGEHARVLGREDSRYAYAYGIDYNWRDPTDPALPSTTDLYLARVPTDRIQDRAAWRFFAGPGDDGAPRWVEDIGARKPVLHDARTVYPKLRCGGRPVNAEASNVSVISQGGVVYNAPLKRYLYTSWTWYTFEFYEAPTPWGPWRLFMHKDFGATPFYGPNDDPSCPGLRAGGYPTTIPSRYISADGRTMWVQTSTWKRWNFACGEPNYNFGLRKLTLEPFAPSEPRNTPDPTDNLARTGEGCVAIEKCARYGRTGRLNDGGTGESESSFDCEADKPLDFWGYTWTRAYHLDRVAYTTGKTFDDGGWFDDLKVQVRQNFRWVDVRRLRITPAYPCSRDAGPNKRYVLDFLPTWGDGVRILGKPGGKATFTTIAELEAYYVH